LQNWLRNIAEKSPGLNNLKKISDMSLAFDEFGRPYLIVRDQAQKRRLKGADAYKVTFSSPSSNLNRPT
jgi:hypothetical protein